MCNTMPVSYEGKTIDGWEIQSRIAKVVMTLEDGSLNVVTYDHPSYFGNGFVIPSDKVKGLLIAGDAITLYSGGNHIRGYAVNGVLWHYVTKDEAEQERLDWLKNEEIRKQRQFDDNIHKWQDEIKVLYPEFYNRIRKFENQYGYETFWKEGGPYELFIYQEAQKLINRAKVLFPTSPVFQISWVEEFKELPYEKQKAFHPDVSDDHSGNTWHCMIGFAIAYLEGKL